jgi:hypothetical protein
MGGVDVHAHGVPALAGMQGGAGRSERLGQYAGRAPVQQAVRLGVALDWHAAHDPLGAGLEDLHPQPLVQADLAFRAREQLAFGHDLAGGYVRHSVTVTTAASSQRIGRTASGAPCMGRTASGAP